MLQRKRSENNAKQPSLFEGDQGILFRENDISAEP